MNVTSASSAAATQSPTPPRRQRGGPDSLDYNAFLQLLIAQMKNQDPTKPTDPSQFIAQLASFSSVEQAIKTNSKLDTMMTSLALSQAEGLIGRTRDLVRRLRARARWPASASSPGAPWRSWRTARSFRSTPA